MSVQSYIGITGFTDPEQSKRILSVFPSVRERCMIGVLLSDKTLRGEPSRKFPYRYIPAHEIMNIFQPHRRAFNTIHFNSRNADQTDIYTQELRQVVEIGGEYCDGIQLNNAWPSVMALRRFNLKHPDHELILQIGKKSIEDCQNNPREIAYRTLAYQGLVHHFLVDPSGGTGTEPDPVQIQDIVQELQYHHVKTNIGIAGGLGPQETDVEWCRYLLTTNPDLSTDMEEKVRDENDQFSVDKAMDALDQILTIKHPRGTGLKVGNG